MGLKLKNGGHAKIYECCDLTEKVYLKRARVGMRVKAIRLSIVGWRLICWWLDLFYTTACCSYEKKTCICTIYY